MDAILIKDKDGSFHLSHVPSGWWIGDTDHEKVKQHKGEQILSKLSLQNCQAIELGYDLDELAKQCVGTSDRISVPFSNGLHFGFTSGFLTALEILGDKKFSEEDMINFAEYCKGDLMKTKDLFNEYQSLQKTEWCVEVVMENKPYKYLVTIGEVTTSKLEPKLDADGCLILKRK